LLLFGKNRKRFFPDASIRCARFRGETTSQFIDQTEIDEYLPVAVEHAISFIERHTRQGIEIGRVKREERPEYPPPIILNIDKYQEMLERLEDMDDLRVLEKMREKPLKYRKLDDFLMERPQSA
jgi:hypothetical protein